MKKYDKETSLAKIKIKINKYFEDVGRDMVEDLDIARQELIEDIDEILNLTNLSSRHLILEQLELDNETKEALKETW